MERHGEDFFRRSRQDAKKYLYRDDQDSFIEAFTKENVLAAIDSQGAFTYTYRLMNDGEPVYANMKAMRMRYVNDHIIIGVSNIDSQMRDNEIRKT